MQTNNKDQILSILHHNSYLCDSSLIKKLLSNEVYDACIYSYQILGKLDQGINLAKREIIKNLNDVFEELNSKKYLSTDIDSKATKFNKFVNLGLGICQKSNNTEKNEKFLIQNYWLPLINSIYDFQTKFIPVYNKNKNNYKTDDYKKIYNELNKAFEKVFSEMADYISLPMILDILCEKCREEGLTKFKQLMFMMISNFRLGENIAHLAINLSESIVDVEIKNYLYEKSKGKIASFIKCAECNVYLWRGNIEEIKYFNCNHIYHKVCFLKKEINDECYICKKNDCIVEKNKNIMKNSYFPLEFLNPLISLSALNLNNTFCGSYYFKQMQKGY
jgi:hypothetical protein